MNQFNFGLIVLVLISVANSTLITIRKKYGALNSTVQQVLTNNTLILQKHFLPKNISAPSNINTTIVSSAMSRLTPLPVASIPSIPYVVKTKSWVPTCPSTMPIICPCQALNSSTTTNQPIKISEFPSSTKVAPRTYLRGGFYYTEKTTKKNLRGSNN